MALPNKFRNSTVNTKQPSAQHSLRAAVELAGGTRPHAGERPFRPLPAIVLNGQTHFDSSKKGPFGTSMPMARVEFRVKRVGHLQDLIKLLFVRDLEIHR